MNVCALCKSKEQDDCKYGEFLQDKKEKMAVHFYCLYLTSNLQQSGYGDSSEGFYGFLPKDIRKEAGRIKRLRCCYCREEYANIGCCENKCRRSFHLVCGIENGAENQFIRTFNSYCHDHVTKVRLRPKKDEQCVICYENLIAPGQRFCGVNMVQAPCCKNGWFHKYCLQNFAKSAGYFFKCPLCNDTEIVRKKLPYKGIFIPDRDAAWELEPNAFADLLERPNECNAATCTCRGGRTENSTSNALLNCNTCGSNAIHKRCQPESIKKDKIYICNDCNLRNNSFCEIETDEEVDVCNVYDKAQNKNDVVINLCNNRQKVHELTYTHDESLSEDEILAVKRHTTSKIVITDGESSSENEILAVKKRRIKSKIFKSDDESSSEDEILAVKRRTKSKGIINDDENENENTENIISKEKTTNHEDADSSQDELETFWESLKNKGRDSNQDLPGIIENHPQSNGKEPHKGNTEICGDSDLENPISSIIDLKVQQYKNSYDEDNECEIGNELNTFSDTVSKNPKEGNKMCAQVNTDELANIFDNLPTDEEYISETSDECDKHSDGFYFSSTSVNKVTNYNAGTRDTSMRADEASCNARNNNINISTISISTYSSESNDEFDNHADQQYFSEASFDKVNNENTCTKDISCIARRTRKRKSMLAVEALSSKNHVDTQNISCIAKRTRKRTSLYTTPIPEESHSINSTSIEQQSSSWSSAQQTPSTFNSETTYKSCLSTEEMKDSLPSTSGSAADSYSNSQRKVFVKKKPCATKTQARGRLSSTDDEDYVISKRSYKANILQRNFYNENQKSPMRSSDVFAYITPEFQHVDGKLKISMPTYLSNHNPVHQRQNNFKNSYNFLVGKNH